MSIGFNDRLAAEKVFSSLTAMRMIPDYKPRETLKDLNAHIRSVLFGCSAGAMQ